MFTLVLVASLVWGFSREEFAWVYTWIDYDRYLWEESREEYINTYGLEGLESNDIIIPIPLLNEEYPQAAAQFDQLVKASVRNHHSLVWALDSLKPTSGAAASVPDSLRRMMLYYIYHDNFARLTRPWFFDGGDIYLYFSDGTGTYEGGWVRYSFLNAAPSAHGFPELWHMGYCTIIWSKTSDTTVDSLDAQRMFNDALQKRMLVNPLSTPVWSTILSIDEDTFHEDYRIPAWDILIPVEYECCELYPEIYRKQDTLLVRSFITHGYEYLIAYPNKYGKKFQPFNDFLTF